MSKIFVTVLFLLVSLTSLSQVTIVELNGNVNTINSEFNFTQINDTIAFYTKYYYSENILKSRITKSKKVNDVWFEIDDDNYLVDGYNTGNFSYSQENNAIFFSVCSYDNKSCDIYRKIKNNLINISDIYFDLFNNTYNSQPHFFKLNNQSYLAFVSDRKGGFGGLDIWFSLIDSEGNFGMPINAGSRINSSNNEITPYYNYNESKLFFSSNDTLNSLGGYDIFSSEGFPNKWQIKENMIALNSSQDEMYLTFYNKGAGYFASNRSSDCLNPDSCCTNIYKFLETQNNLLVEQEVDSKMYTKFLPLNLYFDNDQPNESDFYKSSNYSYKDAYVNYFIKLDDYLIYNNDNINIFFEDSLQANFNKLNKLLDILYKNLNEGYTLDIKIRGYASQLADDQYNIDLSSLRIKSLINYFKTYRNGLLFEYLNDKKLNIIEVPLGESQSIEKSQASLLLNIYGTDAMLNRKVSILKIDAYK